MSAGVNKAISNLDWSFSDDVFLITTNAKGERVQRTMQELNKVGLGSKVKIRAFKADDEDRVRGCFTSHIAVLEEVEKSFAKLRKNDYTVMILEDNLEVTKRFESDSSPLSSVRDFVRSNTGRYDVFHLGYMMYVPGLQIVKSLEDDGIVQLLSGPQTSVGTSAYCISKSGVDAVLDFYRKFGYQNDAIPNIMAKLFPKSRFAVYPMVFHRAAKVGSLVNPQLDDFRKIMFSPLIYTTWERLMFSTGLSTNKLFPTILVSLLTSTILIIISAAFSSFDDAQDGSRLISNFNPAQMVLAAPLFVALWGATLFQSGKGFSASQKQ